MASCPNCGFDLNTQGICSVCGYGTVSEDQLEAVGSSVRARRSGAAGESDRVVGGTSAATLQRGGPAPRRGNLPLIIGGIAVLVVLAGVGVFVALHNKGGASGTPVAQTQQAPAPDAAKASSTTPPSQGSAGGSTEQNARVEKASSSKDGAAAKSARAKVTKVGFSAPVGASPESIRATHPTDLYNPPTQPVYNITKRTQFPPLTSENAYVKWMLAHTNQQEKYLRERWVRATKAVDRHLVIHRRVLMAFLLTPREWFVRPYNLKNTYENSALPIGYGQTISGPDLVAHMTDALDPQPNQRILEIGTGSGYQSAVLSQLSNYVYTIEIVRPLAEQTNQIYLEHTKAMPEYANIHRRLADGYYGWPAYAPFDRIIVTTGIDHIPPDLLKELKPGGIMVIPIGPPSGQTILKITKTVDKQGRVHLTRQDIYHGIKDIFVPFTASGGGTHDLGGNGK